MYFYSTDFEYIKGKITNYFDESYLNTYHLYKKSIASFNNLFMYFENISRINNFCKIDVSKIRIETRRNDVCICMCAVAFVNDGERLIRIR